jgi:tellurite resistance protein
VKLKLKDVHIGMYGAVMGLAGLGLSARAAAPVLPGTIRAPAYFTEPWVLLGALALVLLLPLYVVKLFKHPAEARKDFTNPALMGFTGAPYFFPVANFLWWAGFVLLVIFQVWALSRWLSGSIELAHVNAGWLIVLVGGIVAPGPGVALGHEEASRFVFGVSAAAAPLLMALLFYRAVLGAPLPEPLRPSWFILLVPPTLVYANGMLLFPGSVFLENLFFASLVLVVSLLVVSRSFLRWQFGAPWWAFTFPLDALAYAAARYAQDHPSTLWRAVCAATLALATAFVLIVLFRTLRSAASRRA